MTDQDGVIEIQDFSVVNPGDDGVIKDFTVPGKPKRFKIDNDVFECVRSIPLFDLAGMASLTTNISAENIEKIGEIFKVFIMPESYEKFYARLSDKKNPIGMEHLAPLIHWILEQYGVRPTQPSAGSSTTSPAADGSTSSTVGASVDPLTGQSYPPGVLST